MEKRIYHPASSTTMRLIKSEDLNHHGTLFAGRTAEWFVESGFIAAAALLVPKNVVCLKIHGMYFTSPALPGEVLKFDSRIVYTGKSSLVAYIKVTKADSEKPLVDGFVTFIHVDENTHPMPHNIEVQAVTEEDKSLMEIAMSLKNK
jgi:acyl-CoA hydrolase